MKTSYTKLIIFALLVVAGGLGFQSAIGGRVQLPQTPFAAPEFTHSEASEWINSKPLTLTDLRGKVVLIDFWTFGCWNCYRSFPWLRALEDQHRGKDFEVIGVHTPESDRERVRSNIVEKVKEFKLHHPVMIDNDLSYWRAMRNRYWPAFYLLDKQGKVRHIYVGETHKGDRKARAIEASIRKLLAEKN